MTLVPVPELIVVSEELVLIAIETYLESPDLGISACIFLPEFLDYLLVHNPPTVAVQP